MSLTFSWQKTNCLTVKIASNFLETSRHKNWETVDRCVELFYVYSVKTMPKLRVIKAIFYMSGSSISIAILCT